VEEEVKVKVIKYKNTDEAYCKEKLNVMGKPMMPTMINNICDFEPRTDLILNEIKADLEEGRKILLLSDRREHLKILKVKIDAINPELYESGFFLGGMKKKDRELSEEKNVILATFQMASEGFDCKYPLHTLIMASPKSNIEQSVGRILRQEAKYRVFTPKVIDIYDNFSMFSRQGDKRIAFYKKNKYTIDFYNENNQYVNSSKSNCGNSNSKPNSDNSGGNGNSKTNNSFIIDDDDE